MLYVMLISKRILIGLMENQTYEKRKICDLMIKYGVDLSTVLNSGSELVPNLVIMYSAGPRSFVHDFAHQHIGLGEYWSMDPVNSWILRAIARSEARFSARLESQEQELRYSRGSKNKNQVLDFSIETQLMEMERSSPSERQLYIIAICAGGTASELDALLMHPKEIPELDIDKDKGVRARKYLDISAACGNMETFRRLLDAGVDYHSHQERIWWLLSGNEKIPTHFNNSSDAHENRAQMMRGLLSNVSTTLSETLPPMIVLSGRQQAGIRLSYWLNYQMRFWESTGIQTNAALSDTSRTGSFVAAATIAENVPALELLVHNGFDLEWEDENGFTPLMIALARGSTTIAQILIDAGADLQQHKSCGFSVSELVRRVLLQLKSHQSHGQFISDSEYSALSEIFEEGALINLFRNYPAGYHLGYYLGYFLSYFPGLNFRDHFFHVTLRSLGNLSANFTSITELSSDCPQIEDTKRPDNSTENGEFNLKIHIESQREQISLVRTCYIIFGVLKTNECP